MAKYHKYVFNVEKRKFVGRFEEMYAREDKDNFDSWFQDDLRGLKYIISKAVLDQYNFSNILDIGCGKGTFTHLLKKKNNKVLGIDVSKTAVCKAQAKYPDINFKMLKAENILSLKNKFDLVVCMEILSYLKDWERILGDIAKVSEYIFISLYLPSNPIGYVKTFDDLSEKVEKYFTTVTKIVDETDCDILILAKSKQYKK